MSERGSRIRKKRATLGVCKVSGYAYTRKYKELQQVVDSLQQQALSAKRHVEASKQREMVLLDLTLHQWQVIALFHHHVLGATCQLQQQQQPPVQQKQQPVKQECANAEQNVSSGGAGRGLNGQSAALQLQVGITYVQRQQQPQCALQELHTQLLQQVQYSQEQQQWQQQPQPQQHRQVTPEQLLEPPEHAAALHVQAQRLLKLTQQQARDTTGYMANILQAAAADPAQKHCVMTMTAADWSKFFTESFYKLLLLLELSDRGDEVPCEQLLQRVPLAGYAPPGGSTAACCGLDSTDGGAVSVSNSHPTSHMQQLESLVDEWVMKSALALILHPLPVYMATTINHATQVACAAPPGHFDRVVRRMQLTKQQMRHFAVVLEEIARLDNAVVAEGGQLARNAACPSTVVMAAEAERNAAAAGGEEAEIAASAAINVGVCSLLVATGTAAADAGAGGLAGAGSRVVPDTAAEAEGSQESNLQDSDRTADTQSAGGAYSDDEGLAPPPAENLLQRNVARLPLHALLLLMFNCSTLTRLQLAKCIVASYPFVPMTGAIAASAARLWHQHVASQQDEDDTKTGAQPDFRHDTADDLCCTGCYGMSRSLHMQQLHVLQHRQGLLDQQLQQWWKEWRGLGLDSWCLATAAAATAQHNQQLQELQHG